MYEYRIKINSGRPKSSLIQAFISCIFSERQWKLFETRPPVLNIFTQESFVLCCQPTLWNDLNVSESVEFERFSQLKDTAASQDFDHHETQRHMPWALPMHWKTPTEPACVDKDNIHVVHLLKIIGTLEHFCTPRHLVLRKIPKNVANFVKWLSKKCCVVILEDSGEG